MPVAPSFYHMLPSLLLLVVFSTAQAARTEVEPPQPKREALCDYKERLAAGTTFPQPADGGTVDVATDLVTAPEAAAVAAEAAAAVAPNASLNATAVNFKGCNAPGADEFAFCDMSLSASARTEDLLNRFTLDQKLGMLSPNPVLGDTCAGYMWNGSSLGNASFLKQIGSYKWLTETNGDITAQCWKGPTGKANKCVTQLPGNTVMASSWNRTTWHQMGLIMSTEMRALRNIGGRGPRSKPGTAGSVGDIGVTGFGPDMNIVRDPRYGRNAELGSEDPFLTGSFAAGLISTATAEEKGVPRMLLYMKHFDAYGVNQTKPSEFGRYNISQYDFWDSFLPAYRMGMHAGAHGVMCAHIAPNGQNACSNKWLLDTLRSWGPVGEHAVVATDCGEIGRFAPFFKDPFTKTGSGQTQGKHTRTGVSLGEIGIMGYPPELAPDCAHATAWMLNNGTDVPLGSPACGGCKNVDCTKAPKCFVYNGYDFGNCTYKNDVPRAIAMGLTDETTVDKAVRRVLWNLMKGGIYDKADAEMAWSGLGAWETAPFGFVFLIS
jgi:hypothetical protein